LPTVPSYSRVEQYFARSDPGSRRTREGLPRVRLPFEFSRDDIPYVPLGTGIGEGRAAALASAPRMTAREQVRDRPDYVNGWILAPDEDLPWAEYHRRIEE